MLAIVQTKGPVIKSEKFRRNLSNRGCAERFSINFPRLEMGIVFPEHKADGMS